MNIHLKLIIISVCLLVTWVVTTFSLIVLWYAQGAGHGWSSEKLDIWRMFIFDIIPGLTSGYLMFGLIFLNNVLKSKKSDEASHAA